MVLFETDDGCGFVSKMYAIRPQCVFESMLIDASPARIKQATGPLNQATGPPQSDAGVGIGMLIGDRDSLT